jgi:hypothetical protein
VAIADAEWTIKFPINTSGDCGSEINGTISHFFPGRDFGACGSKMVRMIIISLFFFGRDISGDSLIVDPTRRISLFFPEATPVAILDTKGAI